MGIQSRGGFPVVSNPSITATGRKIPFKGVSMNIALNTSTQAVRLYFTEDDFTNDVNFWTVGATSSLDKPIESNALWIRSPGGTAAIELMILHRKG